MLISSILERKGPDVATVRPDQLVAVAVALMAERRIGAVVVEDMHPRPGAPPAGGEGAGGGDPAGHLSDARLAPGGPRAGDFALRMEPIRRSPPAQSPLTGSGISGSSWK